MEYSFFKNDYDRPQARLNMEAEAFAHWLSIEMSDNQQADLAKISAVLRQLIAGELYEYEYQGREFHLSLDRQQAKVSANSACQSMAELQSENDVTQSDLEDEYLEDDFSDEYAEQGLNDNSSGLVASCGIEDFQQLLLAWAEYVESD